MSGDRRVQFDLQEYLSEMRAEQRADIASLASTVSTGFSDVNRRVSDHETRIVVVEGSRKTMRWLAGTMIVSALGAFFTFLFVEVPKLFVAGR